MKHDRSQTAASSPRSSRSISTATLGKLEKRLSLLSTECSVSESSSSLKSIELDSTSKYHDRLTELQWKRKSFDLLQDLRGAMYYADGVDQVKANIKNMEASKAESFSTMLSQVLYGQQT